jgi:ankyrin repeat protein
MTQLNDSATSKYFKFEIQNFEPQLGSSCAKLQEPDTLTGLARGSVTIPGANICTSSPHRFGQIPNNKNRKVWTSSVVGIFGQFIIEVVQCSLHAESSHRCLGWFDFIQNTISVSVAYYSPWRPPTPIVRVSYQRLTCPSIALSFPRVLAPDSDIFVYIRAGRIEEIKTLLLEGRASVLDVAAPYGLSTLSMAILYKRIDVYNLLVAAGGNRCQPVYPDTSGTGQLEFWMNFSSQDYRISAAEIFQDETRQIAATTDTEILNGDVSYPGADYDSFTRLQKSVLGLTTESLYTLLPQVTCIDEVDSLGRSALHLAAYKSDFRAIELLLARGGNSGLIDSMGKTPLHISAALDSVPCTKSLIAGGANLIVRDQFGNSPLHHACKLGHLRVIKTLLEYGADVQDLNYFGESPITYANLGGHLLAVQLLQNYGADLTHRDKLGTTVVLDAVWFNSHDSLEFYLKMPMRVDQKLQNGKSVLHIMAEEGDQITMQIFLDFAQNGVSTLNVEDTDDRGRTAMDYLRSRRDGNKASQLFRSVLQRVREASQVIEGMGDSDIFWDAVESQPEF